MTMKKIYPAWTKHAYETMNSDKGEHELSQVVRISSDAPASASVNQLSTQNT